MLRKAPTHGAAVAQALLVTLLWSTSWVLIKIGLKNIPALTFAGLRYTLAFVCLLPFALRAGERAGLARLSRRDWGGLILLGVLIIAVTQGGQFVALSLLPAITTSLMLNFTAPATALLGVWLLRERPGGLQWLGVALFMAGIGVYFYPVALPAGEWLGLGVISLAVVTNSTGAVLSRAINRAGRASPLAVTVVSMGAGGPLMLISGLISEPLPALGGRDWAIIAWLAVVNTAFAFTLWNHTLRTLPAVESSIINNTMTIQIAVLAWIFLGERLNWQTGAGLALAVLGVLLVQWRRTRPAVEPAPAVVETEV